MVVDVSCVLCALLMGRVDLFVDVVLVGSLKAVHVTVVSVEVDWVRVMGRKHRMPIKEFRVVVLFHLLFVVDWHSIRMPWLAADCDLVVNIEACVIVDRILMQVLFFVVCNQSGVVNWVAMDKTSEQGLVSNNGFIICKVLVDVFMRRRVVSVLCWLVHWHMVGQWRFGMHNRSRMVWYLMMRGSLMICVVGMRSINMRMDYFVRHGMNRLSMVSR